MEKCDEKEYQEIVKNWEVDEELQQATHVTGLTVAFIAENDDGSYKLGMKGLDAWEEKMQKEGKSKGQINAEAKRLGNEFCQIAVRIPDTVYPQLTPAQLRSVLKTRSK